MIATIVGCIFGAIVLISIIIIIFTLVNHKRNLNQKKHLGIQLQRQITETQTRIERRATLLKQKSLKKGPRPTSSGSSSPSSENIDSFESEKISSGDSSYRAPPKKGKNKKVEVKHKAFAVESDDSLDSSPKHNIELIPTRNTKANNLKPNASGSNMTVDTKSVASAPTNVDLLD